MFNRVRSKLKNLLFPIFIGSLAILLFGLWYVGSIPNNNQQTEVQTVLLEQIAKNKLVLKDVEQDYFQLSKKAFAAKYQQDNEQTIVHIYQGDSLVYWSTNKFPVSNYADLRFPLTGVIRLQNGWYYSNTFKKNNTTFVSSFGIKRTFPLQNNQLKDYFFEPFPEINATLSLADKGENTIVDDQNAPLFQLDFKDASDKQHPLHNWSFVILLMLIAALCLRLLVVLEKKIHLVLACILILGLRAFALYGNWFAFMHTTDLFNPENLALNAIFPNAGELLLWLMTGLFCCLLLGKVIRLSNDKWIRWGFSVLAPALAIGFPAFVKWVITNSTIPLDLHDMLNLNWFSVGFIVVLAIGAFFLVRMYLLLFEKLETYKNIGMHALYFLLFLLLVNEYTFRLHGFWIIWIYSLYVASGYLYWRKNVFQFSSQLLLLFIISWGITFNCITEGIKKEHEDRVIFANQLADDKDVNAEVDFTFAHEKLNKEPYLKRLFSTSNKPSFSELKDALEFRVFNGYWDRYDVDFYVYNPDTIPVNMNGVSRNLLDELIQFHGKASEMDSSLFYIQDYTTQFNYIFRLLFEKEGKKRLVYGTMRSKRIPEKIGFPRILISKQTAVFESLERYSIAKYFNKQLVSNYGSFPYPLELNKLSGIRPNQHLFVIDGLNEHLVLQKSNSDAIVLTKILPSWLDYLTSTSIILVVLGVLYFICLLFYRYLYENIALVFNMESKIQLALIGLIVVSLIGFSIGSSQILYKQYGSYAYEQIRGKMRALENEVQIRQSNLGKGSIWDRRENFDFQIRRWSKVFQSDVNIFDMHGRLRGSSRSKIYTVGLLGERMNAEALNAMRVSLNSEFIHEENIGSLNYLSGYMPIFGRKHQIIGYLNLLHFDERNAFDNQLKQFFVAILNVFMLLLVLSILIAVFVSNWITKPLQLLRVSFSRVELGKNNQRIDYKVDDEIGYLVSEYNHKLTELADTVAKLAQSERESAWREMAKQVAHEIKNPLTPMKLNIQQLQRVLDPNDPKIFEKIRKVTNSLMEQIDVLTSIANAFSSFAKLPQPNMAEIQVNQLVQTVVDFFHADQEVTVNAILATNDVFILGDKEMLLRVLNNLITNGIQAVLPENQVQIEVSVFKRNDDVVIQVKDNGRGISDDQLERIFEPYFTTKSTGTGLGLAMVKQIVEQHNGAIRVLKTDETGTSIEVVLPMLQK